MTVWHLSSRSKKSIVEKEYFEKDGYKITHQCDYRAGLWSCESASRPDINLDNPDGLDILRAANTWETIDIFDCISDEWILDEALSSEEQDEILEILEEQGISGIDELGWISVGAELWVYGRLSLINKDE